MKYLIIGCNGMAGHMIAQYLKEKNNDVVGFARQKSSVCDTVIGDAYEGEKIKKLLESENFDVVINCIGILNKAVDENLKDGIYINSYFPHFLADLSVKSGSKFIHLSTDCVFSGKKGQYKEDDIADEISYYGRTKFLGEVICKNCLTIRTSIIGPELKEKGVGLFDWFMRQNESVNGYKNVIWSGVTTLELARFIENSEKIEGLYFLTNNKSVSKFELLNLFNKYSRKNKIQIKSFENIKSDKSLISTRKDCNFKVLPYEKMIEQMSKWIFEHKNLYGKYLGV